MQKYLETAEDREDIIDRPRSQRRREGMVVENINIVICGPRA